MKWYGYGFGYAGHVWPITRSTREYCLEKGRQTLCVPPLLPTVTRPASSHPSVATVVDMHSSAPVHSTLSLVRMLGESLTHSINQSIQQPCHLPTLGSGAATAASSSESFQKASRRTGGCGYK